MEEAVRRNIVIGFFDTVYWSRRFRREMAARGAGRTGAPAQISVPEIFVENPDDTMDSSQASLSRDFTRTPPNTSPREVERGSSSSSFPPGRALSINTSLRRRDSRSSSPRSREQSPNASPHLTPQRLQTSDTPYHEAESGRLSFSHSRQGSSVSALGVLDSLDNSAWGQSIRRSFTVKKADSSSPA